MKLKTGQTIRVGFAFLAITAFWQMYNNVIPLVLTNTFHLNETLSGVIMAMDNILALFLLPLFGALSDRCRSRMGRRKPFILFGTIASVALMLLLPVIDNSYAAEPSGMKLTGFIAVLGLILIAMGTYRSPAVALMPDVTRKPLRSRANAIINLMGAVGGIIYLLIAAVMYSEKRVAGLSHVNYMPLFMIVAGIMLISLMIVMLTVDEPRLAAEVREYEEQHPEENLSVTDEGGNEELPKPVKRSLLFLLVSIALWFIAYNAVETWFTTFANRMWNMSLGSASLCLTIATVGAILSYIPVGAIAARVGRRKTIYAGIIMMFAAFSAGFVYTLLSNQFHPVLYVLFVLIGIGWASINVNSLPMVVEMCKSSDIGKYTGMYYTFSMAAQTVTPIVAGGLLHRIGYLTFFPYAAVFAGLAFVTMAFVHHGDSRPEAQKGLEALNVDD
jgi:MFS family permease